MAIAIVPITSEEVISHGMDSRPVSGKRRLMFVTSSSRTTSRTRETVLSCTCYSAYENLWNR
jgi:hypothetical protein